MKRKPFLIYLMTTAAIILGIRFILQPHRELGNQALHSTMEALESLSVLLMAIFLLSRREEGAGDKSTTLALGFLGMGILNTVHATLSPGNLFVYFRAAASLAGGLGFSLAWLPARFHDVLRKTWLVWAVIAGSLLLSVQAFLLPSSIPVMIRQGQFTPAAETINVLAGMLFIAGTWRFMLELYRSDSTEDFLFSLIGLFFGLSGLTFQYSMLWSEDWWFWHVLRLIASVLVLGLLVRRHLQAVTTLKKSLFERKVAEDSLRRSYRFTKTIIDSMNDAISLLDVRDFRIIGVNSVFLKEYGFSDESEVVGKHCYEITHHRTDVCAPPDDICPLAETVRTGEHFSVDHVHYGRKGEKIYVEVSTSPIKDENGKVVEVVHVSRDITDRKLAEKERERLLADIARSNKELEQFAYVASHDLQEPLRMVAGYVQLLEKRYKGRLDQKADMFIRFAVDGVERMQKLIEGLLAYSRVSRHGAKLGAVDANKVFSQAVSNLSASIRECSAAVTRDELPTVLGDETQLIQLFQNLIGNAVKYRKPETLPQVHISAQREGNYHVFSVSDNGIGIQPEYYDRIFQIFQRLHTQGEYAGAGIGLAVCKRIVERHQGRIWIKSDPGQGSTFFFTVPDYQGQNEHERELQAMSS